MQWHWLEDAKKDSKAASSLLPDADQFNSLHEKLIERLKGLQPAAGRSVLYLASVKDNDEDFGTVEYLRDCALQAGWDARQIAIEDLGWDGARFVDLEDRPVHTLFKLYPWEWLAREEFGQHLLGPQPAELLGIGPADRPTPGIDDHAVLNVDANIKVAFDATDGGDIKSLNS